MLLFYRVQRRIKRKWLFHKKSKKRRLQIAALKKVNSTIANIESIAVFQENSLVKYRLGSFNTYKEARNSRAQLIRVYKGAFVQALLNDAPIAIKEALQY